MFGRKELASLDEQKQALLLQSGLNRVALQGEIQNLHSATAWMKDVTVASRKLAPALLLLASIGGFFFARGSRRSGSWLTRLMALAKWVPALYRLWKGISARRSEQEPGKPTI